MGKASELASTLEWFILHWLPYSNYHAIDGYELELYPEGYDVDSEQAQMQYWIPVEPNDALSLKPKNRRISSQRLVFCTKLLTFPISLNIEYK
nr:GyrI-like domain-containing protein [Vibrio alginolyticus]